MHSLHNLGSKKEDDEIANYKSIHLDLLYIIAIATQIESLYLDSIVQILFLKYHKAQFP